MLGQRAPLARRVLNSRRWKISPHPVGKDETGWRTDALLIIKSGSIIYERYGRGFDETKRHISWSVQLPALWSGSR